MAAHHVQKALWPAPVTDSDFPLDSTKEVKNEAPSAASSLSFSETLLALGSIKGLGHKSITAFFDALGGALEHVWNYTVPELQSKLEEYKVISLEKIAKQIVEHREELASVGIKQFDALSSRNVKIIHLNHLPESLRQIPNPPRWLFVEGDESLLYYKPAIAVVGTRKPTWEGERAAGIVARHMSAYPVVLVSGLAEGIDQEAHRVSLNENLKNVAFLGHGINLVFPASTRDLREKIIEKGGAIVTEYLPSESYRKFYFVERNRLQAALSQTVIPVQANPKGGTAHTIRFARAFRRNLIGIRWEGANGILQELDKDGFPIIDIFTQSGRKRLDKIIRELAESYEKPTYALSIIERRLISELSQRDLRESDISHLTAALKGLVKDADNS